MKTVGVEKPCSGIVVVNEPVLGICVKLELAKGVGLKERFLESPRLAGGFRVVRAELICVL